MACGVRERKFRSLGETAKTEETKPALQKIIERENHHRRPVWREGIKYEFNYQEHLGATIMSTSLTLMKE